MSVVRQNSQCWKWIQAFFKPLSLLARTHSRLQMYLYTSRIYSTFVTISLLSFRINARANKWRNSAQNDNNTPPFPHAHIQYTHTNIQRWYWDCLLILFHASTLTYQTLAGAWALAFAYRKLVDTFPRARKILDSCLKSLLVLKI